MANNGAEPIFQNIFINNIFYFLSVKSDNFCEASAKKYGEK